MKRAIGILVAMVLLLGSIGVANAAPITVTWNGPSDGDFPAYASIFPATEINFAGFQANTLTSITGPGYAHNHGDTNVVFTIDLNINGTWTTIDSYTLDTNDHLLSERTTGGPINFSGGTITGIRLTDVPAVGFGYHNLTSTEFNFDTTASAVPEPTTMAMLGMAAFTAAGHFGWRRRKQAVVV